MHGNVATSSTGSTRIVHVAHSEGHSLVDFSWKLAFELLLSTRRRRCSANRRPEWKAAGSGSIVCGSAHWERWQGGRGEGSQRTHG